MRVVLGGASRKNRKISANDSTDETVCVCD